MSLNRYWEIELFEYAIILFIVGVVCVAWLKWWQRQRVWKHVPRHMGSTYDASVDAKVRPNVRRA